MSAEELVSLSEAALAEFGVDRSEYDKPLDELLLERADLLRLEEETCKKIIGVEFQLYDTYAQTVGATDTSFFNERATEIYDLAQEHGVEPAALFAFINTFVATLPHYDQQKYRHTHDIWKEWKDREFDSLDVCLEYVATVFESTEYVDQTPARDALTHAAQFSEDEGNLDAKVGYMWASQQLERIKYAKRKQAREEEEDVRVTDENDRQRIQVLRNERNRYRAVKDRVDERHSNVTEAGEEMFDQVIESLGREIEALQWKPITEPLEINRRESKIWFLAEQIVEDAKRLEADPKDLFHDVEWFVIVSNMLEPGFSTPKFLSRRDEPDPATVTDLQECHQYAAQYLSTELIDRCEVLAAEEAGPDRYDKLEKTYTWLRENMEMLRETGFDYWRGFNSQVHLK